MEDFDALWPACVAMFTEEVGVSPTSGDGGASYRARLEQLIRSGRAVNLPEMSRAPQVKVFYGQRNLIAIATRVAGTLFHPGIVFLSSAA